MPNGQKNAGIILPKGAFLQTQLAFTCWKLTIETLAQGVKCVQS